MSNKESQFAYEDRLQRVTGSLRAWGVDAIIVTTASDLRYLTGFGGTTSLGPNPFTGGPSAALVVTPGAAHLCLPASDVGEVSAGSDVKRGTFPTFLDLEPLYPRERLSSCVLNAMKRSGVSSAVLGYQGESLPAALYTRIADTAPTLKLVDIAGCLGHLRMRKSSDEIEALRRSVRLCDHAQAIVREMSRPGVRELEILAAVRDMIEAEARAPLPLIHQITSGPGSASIESPTSERVLGEGDLVLSDLAPQLNGYWGDSCASRVVGEPTNEQARMLRVAAEALEKGTEAVRPGVPASEVDRVMRGHVAASFPAYPNSGGHGIGLDYHEPPRLVPDEELVLEENMILALEPGVYLPGTGGVRLEHLVLVEGDGCEVLSRHLRDR